RSGGDEDPPMVVGRAAGMTERRAGGSPPGGTARGGTLQGSPSGGGLGGEGGGGGGGVGAGGGGWEGRGGASPRAGGAGWAWGVRLESESFLRRRLPTRFPENRRDCRVRAAGYPEICSRGGHRRPGARAGQGAGRADDQRPEVQRGAGAAGDAARRAAEQLRPDGSQEGLRP